MISKKDKNASRQKRHIRIRKDINGTASVPRLNVYRSSSHIYGQIIDDDAQRTLVAASTVEKEIAKLVVGKSKVETATIVGEAIAKKALKNNIKKVVFDRGGYLYTGRVAAFAEGARKGGLEF